MEPRWLRLDVALAIHERLISEFGGDAGIHDLGLLESAIARPKQIYSYENSDLSTLAAAYTAGIVRNHPFVDGNKRVGFLASLIFLGLNKLSLTASEAMSTQAVINLVTGEITEQDFAQWLRENIKPVSH
jgi:death on curing protein